FAEAEDLRRVDGAGTRRGDRRQRRFADALDQGRACAFTRVRGEGCFAGTVDQGRAGTLRGERRDSRLAGTSDAGVDDNAYTFRHDPRQGGFAGTVDEGSACTVARVRGESCLAGTLDQGRAGPGAGHRRKGRFARPDDRRFVAPVEPWRVVAGDDGGSSAGDLMGVAYQVVDRVGDGLLVERPQRVRFGVEPGVQRLV